MHLLGIDHRMSAAYNPRCNGLVERQNRTTQSSMVKSLIEDQANWFYILPSLEMSFRMVRHSSTGLTPYEMMFGRKPLLPAELNYYPLDPCDIDIDLEERWPTQEEVLASAERVRSAAHDHAAINIKKAQEKQAQYFNARHQGKVVQIGTLVLVYNSKDAVRMEKSLRNPWSGPYRVVEVYPNGNLRLMNPKTNKILANKVPANRVQLYVQRKTYLPSTRITESKDPKHLGDVTDDIRIDDNNLNGVDPDAMDALLDECYPEKYVESYDGRRDIER